MTRSQKATMMKKLAPAVSAARLGKMGARTRTATFIVSGAGQSSREIGRVRTRRLQLAWQQMTRSPTATRTKRHGPAASAAGQEVRDGRTQRASFTVFDAGRRLKRGMTMSFDASMRQRDHHLKRMPAKQESRRRAQASLRTKPKSCCKTCRTLQDIRARHAQPKCWRRREK